MGFAVSTRNLVDPRLCDASPLDPRDGSALSPSGGAVDDVRVDSLGRRMSTEDATYANTQLLTTFPGTRSVGAHVVDVANPTRDCLARSVSGPDPIYRLVRLNGTPDEITMGAGAWTAPASFTYELWGRIRTGSDLLAANSNFLSSYGHGPDASNSDWVLQYSTTTGQLQARVFRYSGAAVTLTSSLDIYTPGSLFYAALTVTGTTATLYGMVAGGALAQLDQDTCAAAPTEVVETLYIGSFISAGAHTLLDVAGFRWWEGVAHSLADLTRIAGRSAKFSHDNVTQTLVAEALIPAADWESTTTLTDSSFQGTTITLVSVAAGDWATTPNDLTAALDSGWVNLRGPWDDRPVVSLNGTTGGVSASTSAATPCVEVGLLAWLPNTATKAESWMLWFGTAAQGAGCDWSLKYSPSDGTIKLLVYRNAATPFTASVAVTPGPQFIDIQIDPFTAIATLTVNGVSDTVGSLPAFSAIASSKLNVGDFSANVRSHTGEIGPLVICSSIPGTATMKQWLREGPPYDAQEDIRHYYKMDEATGTASTDYGAVGADITWDASVAWSRRDYPASVLGPATPGGHQDERVPRHIAVASADADADGLWVGVHDPENPDGFLAIGRAMAFETNRFDVGKATGAENLSMSPWLPTGTPGELSCSVVVSGQELAEVMRLVQRDAPQVVSVRTGNARRRAIESRYGKLSMGASSQLFHKDKFEAEDESVGATVNLTLREEQV